VTAKIPVETRMIPAKKTHRNTAHMPDHPFMNGPL